TGVPHDIASINTNPKGSGQAIGASSAMAPLRRLDFSLSLDGKTGKTDSNRDESATNRNHEPVGELAQAWRYATHSGRGPSRPNAMPSANMPPGWPRFANRRSRTRQRHVRVQPVRRPTTK